MAAGGFIAAESVHSPHVDSRQKEATIRAAATATSSSAVNTAGSNSQSDLSSLKRTGMQLKRSFRAPSIEIEQGITLKTF